MLYFFHSQYLLPSAAEVSREAFQMSHRFLILLLLDDWGKQKITALHSLNIYSCQITSSSFITSNHCALQESCSCLWYTLRGKIAAQEKKISSQVGEKYRLRSYHFVPQGKDFLFHPSHPSWTAFWAESSNGTRKSFIRLERERQKGNY